MATIAAFDTPDADIRFFRRMATAMAAFIVFGFLQFAARGMVDYRAVPIWFHLHGLAMVSWLGFVITQATIAERADLSLHRTLGRTGLALSVVLVALMIRTVMAALQDGFVPPFFTHPFFAALVTIEAGVFLAMVWAAARLRKRTDWHRRLMIGSTVLLLEPALGRLLPMPITGGENGEWIAMVVQLGAVALIARHDRRGGGQVHPATLWVGAAVVGTHAAVSLAARTAAFAQLAAFYAA